MDHCPTRGEWLSSTPRGRILATRDVLNNGLFDPSKSSSDYIQAVFECTLCGRCKVNCSVSIDSPGLWVDLRRQIAEKGLEPQQLKDLAGVIDGAHNLSGKSNDQRANWMKRITLQRAVEKNRADTIYFVGCVTSFYPMVQDIARSFAQLLDKAGISFTVLGGEEWCCGYPLISAGHEKKAVEALVHNAEAIRSTHAKEMVVTCPGCYRMWKEEYPRLTGQELGINVLHSTELIVRLLSKGMVRFEKMGQRITYHDPCDLGRISGIFDEPRSVIASIPDIDYLELRESREESQCCGSGGDLLACNQQLSLTIAARKVEEALLLGAETLVTACPSCIRALKMAKTATKANLDVLDIAELAWKAMVK
jgi:Fe-S oxidoreductase